MTQSCYIGTRGIRNRVIRGPYCISIMDIMNVYNSITDIDLQFTDIQNPRSCMDIHDSITDIQNGMLEK